MSKKPASSQALRRGKACLVCRQLKIKCDGNRPLCGPCRINPKDDQCEFNDATSRRQELEDTVARLHSRVIELERGSVSQTWSSAESSSAGTSPSSPLSGTSVFGIQEPPLVMLQVLLDHFIPHATQFGFFLHIENFKASAILPLPFGDPLRPSGALLSTVYLWGVHLSQLQHLLSSESIFLKRAQQQLSVEISEDRSPAHALHTIQAQVLLSNYMLRNRRFLEAEFHANSAATLTIAYQLHRICSSRVVPSFINRPGTDLGPPLSSVDEGERIQLFLDGRMSAKQFKPWPELTDYQARPMTTRHRSQETIKKFMTDTTPPSIASPPSTLQAQAMVLLHRASRLGSKWSPTLQPEALASFLSSCSWLDSRITTFWTSLPPLYNGSSQVQNRDRTSILIHSITAMAFIALYRGLSTSSSASSVKCIFAARAVLATASSPLTLNDHSIHDLAVRVADPLLGTLCTLACAVIMDGLREEQRFRRTFHASVGLDPPPSAEENRLVADLQNGIRTMQFYAPGNPLVQYQLEKVQQEFESLQ
ncbi:hypothetical protein C8F01DRAFT_1340831 [Mycena amicta]|nr:hypothetical protein C8F01DRAFT_1340831 [Mycena amicta]